MNGTSTTPGRRRRRTGILAGLAAALAVLAQEPATDDGLLSLKFIDSPVSMLLNQYAEITERTLLLDPKVGVGATVTLKSKTPLTREEYLEAIESILGMNGIALQTKGDKFLRVVPSASARKYPMGVVLDPATPPSDTDALVSQMIVLKHIELTEANKAIEHLRSANAQTQPFERMNSILVTDAAANIGEILKLVEFIDVPSVAREELVILRVRFSKASEIKTKLEEIVAQAQTEEQKKQAQTASARPSEFGPPRLTPGIIRSPTPEVESPATPGAEDVKQGLIRGTVKIVADDRTGILIFITRPENMPFFEQIVAALDVETQPDVVVQVIRLEFADAKTIAGMLNDLIGASKKDELPAVPTVPGGGEDTRSRALVDYIARRAVAAESGREKLKSQIGELSAEQVKILPDERTNALVIMASRADVQTLEDIIREMDLMLSQVLIEVVIIEVGLSDNLQTGFDWLQKMLIVVNETGGVRTPVAAFAGRGGGGFGTAADVPPLVSADTVPGGLAGLTYYFTHFGLNVDVLLKMTATDSRARVLSSPVILTTDNTPATTTVDEQIYVRTGSVIDQFGNTTTQTDIRNVGLSLEVTPHINKNKFVMLEIKQSISNLAGTQLIDGNEFPTTATRSFNASITVRDRETVILGGLVREDHRQSSSGIPVLKDFPLVGRLFSSKSSGKDRREVIVLITPYVSATPVEMESESARRVDAVHHKGLWERGWTDSKLAAEPPTTGRGRPQVVDPRDSAAADAQAVPSTAVTQDSAPAQDAAVLERLEALLEEMKSLQAGAEEASRRVREVAMRAEQLAAQQAPPAAAPALLPTPADVAPPLPAPASPAPLPPLAVPPPAIPTLEQQVDLETLRFIQDRERRARSAIENIDARVDGRN